MRVRPYYLYQWRSHPGLGPFPHPRCPRAWRSSRAFGGTPPATRCPPYVIDAPGGGGKVALYPDSVVGRRGSDLLLRNYAGETYTYPDNGGGQGQLLS